MCSVLTFHICSSENYGNRIWLLQNYGNMGSFCYQRAPTFLLKSDILARRPILHLPPNLAVREFLAPWILISYFAQVKYCLYRIIHTISVLVPNIQLTGVQEQREQGSFRLPALTKLGDILVCVYKLLKFL